MKYIKPIIGIWLIAMLSIATVICSIYFQEVLIIAGAILFALFVIGLVVTALIRLFHPEIEENTIEEQNYITRKGL